MKILLFTDSLGAGGAQRQLVGLSKMLNEKGFQVKVCTYHNLDFYKSFLDENKIENELIPDADNSKKRILAVRSYFNKEKPDWVIAYQETPSLVACMCKLLGGRFRLLVSERNTTQKIGMNERVRFFLYRFADAIVPNSYAQEKFLVSRCPWMKRTIKTISNFVDVDAFSPNYKKRGTVANFLVVGSIAASKNTHGFIEACKLLKEKKINVHFTWYGWTNNPNTYMQDMKSLIEKYDVADLIEFKQKRLDIAFAYQEAEYYCMPSFFEGTPNVLCEAISSGLPSATSNVCDNAIYTKDGYNGFLFNPNKPDEIAASIEKLIKLSDEEYDKYCHNSRELALNRLSKDVFINKYLDIIQS